MRIMTINAEDWYNGYISPQDRDWGLFEYRVDKWLIPMLDELDQRQIRAVVFCTGWLADHHPEIIRETARRGYEIGCNGYWHIEPNTMSMKERFMGYVGVSGGFRKYQKMLEEINRL